MFTNSFKKLSETSKLIYQFATVMIRRFARNDPEKIREMFRKLYDEKFDIWQHFKNFKLNSKILFEKYGKPNEKHLQIENAINVYLWLKYPDKYYIYKLFTLEKTAKILKSDYEFV